MAFDKSIAMNSMRYGCTLETFEDILRASPSSDEGSKTLTIGTWCVPNALPISLITMNHLGVTYVTQGSKPMAELPCPGKGTAARGRLTG
ncbi:hypothetical protein FQN53_008706, partial [Emmonsiellopsis sp. PD_33]